MVRNFGFVTSEEDANAFMSPTTTTATKDIARHDAEMRACTDAVVAHDQHDCGSPDCTH